MATASHEVDLDESDDEELDCSISEDEDLIDEFDLVYDDWTTVNNDSDRKPTSDSTFYGLHGLHPKHENVDVKDPISLCDVMLPDELFVLLAHYTNIRAHVDHPSPSSKWTPTYRDEMKKFFGCLLIMGIVRKPRMDMHWSQDDMVETPFFGKEQCLSRDRFFQILKYLRFADYNDLDETDPLRKIAPFIRYVKELIQNAYLPDQHVAIDEILLLFKGRVFFRAFIPSKRSRYGIKIYAIIDQYGYMWDFFINTTASNLKLPTDLVNGEDFGFSGKVVIYLTHKLFDMNYRVFADNFFVSDKLAAFLRENRTHLCGTVRYNRLPPVIKNDFPNDCNTVKHFRKQHILISCFTEKKQSGKKCVSILDTTANPQNFQKSVIKKGGSEVTVTRPSSLESYNKYMGAVDQADAQLHPYDITRKTFNWARKTGIHLMHRLVLNAFSIYKQHNSNMNFMTFTLKYARHLFESTGIGRKVGRKGGRPRLFQEVPQNHIPLKIPATEKKKNPSLRCRVCTSKGERRETRLFCATCESKPPLCAHPCFNIYHNYRQA